MDSTILTSTFLLTLLMMVGLVFFIRASVKDRTEQIELSTSESEDAILPKLQNYFDERAYRVIEVDALTNEVTFQGFVQPSLFMAIFLTSLSGLGFFCLVLVLFMLFPGVSNWLWLMLLLAPVAGIFYWQKAGRLEKVLLSVKSSTTGNQTRNIITVTGHRDELIQFQQNLSFQ
ncbi:MAG: cofactor assembly of complex C subunit B [Xenococcaceae cyanobacterium MO_207.B15]|nr:cofactor assembly of complex C subunit B [Xenococcaceae cyanobacterium MO_207.B15]